MGCEGSSCGGCAKGNGEGATAIPLAAMRQAARQGRGAAGQAAQRPARLLIGLDVGSTTVKAVAMDAAGGAILWQDYRRHKTRQAEMAAEFLEAIEAAFPAVPRAAMRLFVTGSGGGALIPRLGGRFVQEVNAVSLAVEKLHPEAMSVIELGGQDAKIIVFKETEHGKKKISSMNDKCAGGTGAVIDKIAAKLNIAPQALGEMGYERIALHAVAGKCGVFAETDINSLQKQGVPAHELMASLFESIVQQNLSVLTRGHTLRPTVLLLGGPHSYLRGLRESWRHHLPLLWVERGVVLPDPARSPADYVIAPQNAQYFAAIGAIEFGRAELEDDAGLGRYLGTAPLREHLAGGRAAQKLASGARGLAGSAQELAAFKQAFRPRPWSPAPLSAGEVVEAFLGLDGGSTSTKGVLLGPRQEVLAKAYLLSRGNPIEDVIEIVARLAQTVAGQGAVLKILGVGTTGYAKDMLRDVLKADVALVETVAHTAACLKHYPDADAIVDVGGQDIKLIMLNEGRVKDFKLNTQCSAGNGYFLQATAQTLGFSVEDYADIAFSAETMPEFGYGCAVFLQSDIVDFQRQGWQANEIMAGLAAVLPKNIWLYVAQMPNLARLGRRFVLQGGTQRNLAAVKAQVDFIRARFHGTGIDPEIIVHPHCGETGAIGAALEARRLWAEEGRATAFIGLERVGLIRYTTAHNEATRCHFCKNECVRTFIDVCTDAAATVPPPQQAAPVTKKKAGIRVPLAPGHQRTIIATCEKGLVEDLDEMRGIKAGLDALMERNPNLVALAAKHMFREVAVPDVADRMPTRPLLPAHKRRRALVARRGTARIGIPRVLNVYSHAPFYIGYFTSLGVQFRNLVFSGYTDAHLYRNGAKRGSIDPCFPSKLAIAHVHDLLYRAHPKRALTHLFLPMVDTMPSHLEHTLGAHACPTAVATAEATHAAFVKEGDVLAQHGVVVKKTFLNLNEPQLAARQMYEDWKDELGLSLRESERAVTAGLAALAAQEAELRARAREALDEIERDGRIGIVVLGRPYHNDPGVNHGILEELQKHGYPIFWQDSLPRDPDLLERLFGEEVRTGKMASALAIDDVWKNSYSEHSSRKLWAAKYVARHPNLVALELSSFKCGHDAPIYAAIEEIVERSGTPYFCFKDIDENKPAGSIRIRIETIVYFLQRYRERALARSSRGGAPAPCPVLDEVCA